MRFLKPRCARSLFSLSFGTRRKTLIFGLKNPEIRVFVLEKLAASFCQHNMSCVDKKDAAQAFRSKLMSVLARCGNFGRVFISEKLQNPEKFRPVRLKMRGRLGCKGREQGDAAFIYPVMRIMVQKERTYLSQSTAASV